MQTTELPYREAGIAQRFRRAADDSAEWLVDKSMNCRLQVEDHRGVELASLPVGLAALGAVLFPKATLMAGAVCLASRCRLSVTRYEMHEMDPHANGSS